MYQQIDETPAAAEYCELRRISGLARRTDAAARLGLPNTLFATVIRTNAELVAMGRVVGDGGCNYEIVDIAVHPEHQRKGLGQRVMAAIMAYIEAEAPASAYVSLIADHHSPALYRKFGFEPTAPVSVGMSLTVD